MAEPLTAVHLTQGTFRGESYSCYTIQGCKDGNFESTLSSKEIELLQSDSGASKFVTGSFPQESVYLALA
jgi:hypothetical protein